MTFLLSLLLSFSALAQNFEAPFTSYFFQHEGKRYFVKIHERQRDLDVISELATNLSFLSRANGYEFNSFVHSFTSVIPYTRDNCTRSLVTVLWYGGNKQDHENLAREIWRYQ